MWKWGCGWIAALLVVGCHGQDATQGAATASVAPPAHTADTAGTGLAYLTSQVGQYPNDVSLWKTEPLNTRLHALLGPQYSTFIANMAVQGPLDTYDDVVWTSGNRAHSGDVEAAVMLADTRANTLEVYLLTDHRLWHHAEREPRIALQGDAQTRVAQLREAAEQPLR